MDDLGRKHHYFRNIHIYDLGGGCTYFPQNWGRWSHFDEHIHGCFLKWWYPRNTPKWSFLIGKPMVLGYHHFRKPPYIYIFIYLFIFWFKKPTRWPLTWENRKWYQLHTCSWHILFTLLVFKWCLREFWCAQFVHLQFTPSTFCSSLLGQSGHVNFAYHTVTYPQSKLWEWEVWNHSMTSTYP